MSRKQKRHWTPPPHPKRRTSVPCGACEAPVNITQPYRARPSLCSCGWVSECEFAFCSERCITGSLPAPASVGHAVCTDPDPTLSRQRCGHCNRLIDFPSSFWFRRADNTFVHPSCHSYALERGPVVAGAEVIPTCGSDQCYNPAHLLLIEPLIKGGN